MYPACMADIRRANGHQRRKLRDRMMQVYDQCALCGGPIDKSLRFPDPGCFTIDEIIPVSKGGDPLDWSNVQPAHFYCNRQKSDRLPVAYSPPRRKVEDAHFW